MPFSTYCYFSSYYSTQPSQLELLCFFFVISKIYLKRLTIFCWLWTDLSTIIDQSLMIAYQMIVEESSFFLIGVVWHPELFKHLSCASQWYLKQHHDKLTNLDYTNLINYASISIFVDNSFGSF